MTDPADSPETIPPGQKPASENPWYILATIYGEDADPERRDKNRRIWNGWACGHMDETERAAFANQHDLDAAELVPWTDAERADVEQVFAHGRGKGMTLPDSSKEVDFINTYFDKPLDMRGFVFSGDALFGFAKFGPTAVFGSATFGGTAAFGFATFSGYAVFEFARFGGTAAFTSATFGETVVFRSATFDGDAVFGSSVFTKAALFTSSTFGGTAVFESATFGGTAVFACATCENFVYFQKAVFKEIAHFSECQFHHPTSFRNAEFQTHFPDFSGAILHQNTTFTAKDEFWPATNEAPAEESREALARIRHAVAGQGLPEEEHYFFRREMRFAGKIGSFSRRLPYRAFGLLSDYGHSIARPALGLAGLWATLGLGYLIGFEYAAEGDFGSTITTTAAQAFGLSFANIFAFLGFHGRFAPAFFTDASPWLIAASGVQTVLGFTLLFFLGLGLRNRFRLR